jgi:hypothetical protein
MQSGTATRALIHVVHEDPAALAGVPGDPDDGDEGADGPHPGHPAVAERDAGQVGVLEGGSPKARVCL